MSDTPDRESETAPVADSTPASPNPPEAAPPPAAQQTPSLQAPPPGPPRGPQGPRPDCPPPPHRDAKPNRLYQVAAWVAIVAGTLFIVCVIFFAGVMVGHSSGGRHEHRGHGHSMQFKDNDRGPGFMMKNRMDPDDDDAPRRAPMSPTTEPARPLNP